MVVRSKDALLFLDHDYYYKAKRSFQPVYYKYTQMRYSIYRFCFRAWARARADTHKLTIQWHIYYPKPNKTESMTWFSNANHNASNTIIEKYILLIRRIMASTRVLTVHSSFRTFRTSNRYHQEVGYGKKLRLNVMRTTAQRELVAHTSNAIARVLRTIRECVRLVRTHVCFFCCIKSSFPFNTLARPDIWRDHCARVCLIILLLWSSCQNVALENKIAATARVWMGPMPRLCELRAHLAVVPIDSIRVIAMFDSNALVSDDTTFQLFNDTFENILLPIVSVKSANRVAIDSRNVLPSNFNDSSHAKWNWAEWICITN